MGSNRTAWAVVAVLAVAQALLSQVVAARAGDRSITYVFTPLVDVVPGGVPLTAGEATELATEARSQVDARDIQKAYARLGSTMSLDDLLRGVEGLEAAGTLTGDQRARVRGVLERARADHAAVYDVQAEILELEARLATEAEGVLAALPPETRARVESRAPASKPAAPPRGDRPPGAPPVPPPGATASP